MQPMTASELASMQNEANSALDTAAVIKRPTTATDAYGSVTKAYTQVATCNVMLALPTGTYLGNLANKTTGLSTWVVSMPIGTNVMAGDHIVLAAATLTVQSVNTPESYAVLIDVLADELK